MSTITDHLTLAYESLGWAERDSEHAAAHTYVAAGHALRVAYVAGMERSRRLLTIHRDRVGPGIGDCQAVKDLARVTLECLSRAPQLRA